MKIVTYNVNGLRQRVAQHGSLLKLLNSLDADIICLQETKLTRQDLSVDVTSAEGYEGFLSCTRGSTRGRFAYSGVATFCRVKSAFGSDEVALPMAAEEGFTGTLHGLKKKEMMVGDFEVELPLNVEGLEDVTNEDLLKVDSEGRCVITDHGHFVLFNLYGPRAQEEDRERIQFKLLFFKVLQKRWQSLLSQGRSVIVVGDLNIAPATIDRCDAEPGFEKDMFRKWLRSLLRDSGGPFFDVFRSKHPARREAYTCFSPRVGAEEFNYGSRIDHILIAGPCLHKENDLEGHNLFNCHAEACDIMVQFKRGKPENTPKWQGGRTIKLDGSDHIPVYAVLSNMRNLSVHNTPPLAVRYIPEVRGWQQTIVSFLGKREKHCFKHPTVPNYQSDENTETQDSWKCALNADNEPTSNVEMAVGSSHFSFHQRLSDSVLEAQRTGSSLSDNSDVLKENEDMVLSKLRKDQSLYRSSTVVMKKGRRSAYSQLTLKSFFKQPKSANSFDTANAKAPQVQADWQEENENMFHKTESSCDKRLPENIEENSSELTVPITDACGQDLSFSSKMEKGNAVLEWQKIQEKMRTSIPLCKGHHEPCVARSVKKGSNVGVAGSQSERAPNFLEEKWQAKRSKLPKPKTRGSIRAWRMELVVGMADMAVTQRCLWRTRRKDTPRLSGVMLPMILVHTSSLMDILRHQAMAGTTGLEGILLTGTDPTTVVVWEQF